MDNPFSSNHSQQSETPRRFQVDSSESKPKFVTPQKAPVIAPSSNEKTVILGRDTNLGFPEVANSESGGSEVVVVEVSESEWREFMVWKRRLASWERPLDERPLKQLVSDPNSDSPRAGAGAGVRHAEENMGKSMEDLKSSSWIHGFQSPKNCLELNDCTEGKVLVSDDAIVKNVLESNDSTEGVVVLDSEEKGLVSDVDIANNGFASMDSTEVVALISEDEGLISGVGVAKNGQVVNDGSNAGRAEEPQHNGEGSENGEYIDKFRYPYVAPSNSDSSSTRRPKAARVLPMSMNVLAKEGNSGEKSQHNGEGSENGEYIDKFPYPYVAPSDSDSTFENRCKGVVNNVLRMLSENCDPRFKKTNPLEFAKLCGCKFARPRCWGEEEEEEKEGW